MRRTTTLTALLLGATLLAPTQSANAVGEICQGEAATIVGVGDLAEGTEGRDVIVSGSAFTINGRGGDDLICVTGTGARSNVLNLDAGAGNDVVDSTAMSSGFYLTAVLGEGSDTFVGGAGGDTVSTGTVADYGQISDAERDIVDTGGGGDSVSTGVAGAINSDEVRLGHGDDGAQWFGIADASSLLDAGEDRDRLSLAASGATYVVDLGLGGSATIDGMRQLGFTGFESYTVSATAGDQVIATIGTEGDDDFTIESAAQLDAHLGGGDDSLIISAAPLANSVIDLGSGKNYLAVRAAERSVELDLEDHALRVDDRATATVNGVENAFVVAREVRLEGDRSANSLHWRGCFGRVEGGAGKDVISLSYDPIWETPSDCSKSKVVMDGGKGNDSITGKLYPARILGAGGNDKLTGSSNDDVILGGGGRDKLAGKSGNDKLLGGGGRDQATGSKGRDSCDAEVEKTCER